VKRAGWVWICGALGCSGAPQTQDQTAITWSASWSAESGINATVVFPAPNDASAAAVQAGVAVDGGTFNTYSDTLGNGFSLAGTSSAAASFFNPKVTGIGSGNAPPTASLTRAVPDAGNTFYFFVNKSGLPTINVQFEYTAQRDCGPGCGGKKSWTYSGSIGTGDQSVQMTYVEEKQP
jgi:hypothetical protein